MKDFHKVRHTSTGYGVVFNSTAHLSERRFDKLARALEAAQAWALSLGGGSAEVFPRRWLSFRFNGRPVRSVRYWSDNGRDLQFLTTEI